MSFSKIYTRGLLGLHAPLIEVEVHVSQGLPSLTIVGLAEAAVRESKDRVRSAALLQKGMISLSPPTICNSAKLSYV
uniref:magnesium chelatase domain-containing protein n=1 Tax=Acinetobacter baumannii TaxID=470 RepID=UPI002948C330